ncbi:Transamidase GatB domain protein [Lunatimonas lonarensis]|uniref:Transamidase GatB domain protein n=1 Tax=Lunatimonas lonarensis TaxID=1232681 RepID=R7ZSZ8_9BACT|nr:GatB/YqeY domain-containing protein [Lunatimonas lonarensis]EON77276.1 Transamidase GatB domain protein [Lunatimonas lonarensis]
MSLKLKIEDEIKKAMLAKEKDRLRALRAIKSLILLDETKSGGEKGLSEEDELKLLTKAAKQRKDSADIFQQQNRKDLADLELSELAVINEFLPRQLSSEELNAELRAIIAEVGAEGPKDMGKVMGAATKKLAGKADGKDISAKVKELLTPQ